MLQIEVPEEVYESLKRSGEQTGQQPEAVAVRWLVSATEHLEDDPLETFIGAFPSNIADWGDDHDKYLGAAILEHGQNKDADDIQPHG